MRSYLEKLQMKTMYIKINAFWIITLLAQSNGRFLLLFNKKTYDEKVEQNYLQNNSCFNSDKWLSILRKKAKAELMSRQKLANI